MLIRSLFLLFFSFSVSSEPKSIIYKHFLDWDRSLNCWALCLIFWMFQSQPHFHWQDSNGCPPSRWASFSYKWRSHLNETTRRPTISYIIAVRIWLKMIFRRAAEESISSGHSFVPSKKKSRALNSIREPIVINCNVHEYRLGILFFPFGTQIRVRHWGTRNNGTFFQISDRIEHFDLAIVTFMKLYVKEILNSQVGFLSLILYL